MKSNFKKVALFNEAIGNEKGNKTNIDWNMLFREADMIESELIELRRAIANKDMEEVRDALCDIHVFAYGTHHKIGWDADKDMNSVIEALYSRFCKTEEQLESSIKHYQDVGVERMSVHGEFPFKYIKSEGNYPDAPKGKFLKSIYYKKQEFNE